MNVKQAIEARRAYRSLDPVAITDELIRDLAESAGLFASCFNNQPWRFVFVSAPDMLKRMHTALSKGNEWAYAGSMIIAVASKKESDCQLKGRDYYLFDTGMGTAALILRATELGFVAHPIAGYDEDKVRSVLGIPAEMTVITLVIVGKHSATISPVLSEKQVGWEKARPERLPVTAFAFMNSYQTP